MPRNKKDATRHFTCGWMSLQASYLGHQARRVAAETALKDQLTRASSHQIKPPRNTRSGTQNNSSPRYYECEGIGHFARECPTRLKRIGNAPNLPGRKNPSERSKRLSSPSEKPQNAATRGGEMEQHFQGNE